MHFLKQFTAAVLLASPAVHAGSWLVYPYTDQMSNVSNARIETRSTNDVAAFVVSCSNPKYDAVSIVDTLVINNKQLTSDVIDVRAGKPTDDQQFIFSSIWQLWKDASGSSLTAPDGAHLRDFMLDGGALEIRYTTADGPETLKFDLDGFALAYREMIHDCK